MPEPKIDTRVSLISAAAALFAEHGTRGVSLREIGRRAGSHNPGVVQYYFGDRDGTVRAVLEAHGRQVAIARQPMLDRSESRDMRRLAAALVRPLAARLDHDDGRAFLQVAAELARRPDADDVVWRSDPSLDRWAALVEEVLEPGRSRPVGGDRVALRLTHIELARRAAVPMTRGTPQAVDGLVSAVAAMLATWQRT